MAGFDGSAKSQQSGRYDGIDIGMVLAQVLPDLQLLVRWFVGIFNELVHVFHQFIMFPSLYGCLAPAVKVHRATYASP